MISRRAGVVRSGEVLKLGFEAPHKRVFLDFRWFIIVRGGLMLHALNPTGGNYG